LAADVGEQRLAQAATGSRRLIYVVLGWIARKIKSSQWADSQAQRLLLESVNPAALTSGHFQG
jgi:hypothetical protein